jgi:hypothetical protein
VPAGPEVRGDCAEGGQEPLGMPRRCKAFHRPFTLPGGLMGIFGPIVQILRLAWVTDAISSRAAAP